MVADFYLSYVAISVCKNSVARVSYNVGLYGSSQRNCRSFASLCEKLLYNMWTVKALYSCFSYTPVPRFCSFWDPFVAFLWGSSLQGFLRVDMKCLSKRRGATDWGFGLSVGTTWTSTKSSCPQKSVQTLQLWKQFFSVFFSYCSRCCEYLSGTHLSCRVCHYESSFVVFAFSYFAILQKKTMIFHFSNTCARENYRIWKFITELSCITCNYLPVSSGSFWGAVP